MRQLLVVNTHMAQPLPARAGGARMHDCDLAGACQQCGLSTHREKAARYLRCRGERGLRQAGLLELKVILAGIFEAAGMLRVPISQHGRGHESCLYLHASKQWEYLFAWWHAAG